LPVAPDVPMTVAPLAAPLVADEYGLDVAEPLLPV
jgi:hypothetical protein